MGWSDKSYKKIITDIFKNLKIVYRKIKVLLKSIVSNLVYLFCNNISIQDKVVATTFRGRKFGDNTKYILEELHKLNPNLDIVWLKNNSFNYEVPNYIRVIDYNSCWKRDFEYATAKVWINTHRIEKNIKKRKGQLFIETWHGGLGIKKIEGDVPKVLETPWEVAEINNTAELADLFISNSKHLTDIYRRAFGYKGKVWKCGYPKNDILMFDRTSARKKVRNWYNLSSQTKIIIYAPTFRDEFWNGKIDMSVYDMDFMKVCSSINKYWDGDWKLFIRWHPVMVNLMSNIQDLYNDYIIDATNYPDMQELILVSDAFISDYSSCIFDAAILNIPCFTFATDFEEYKGDRGVYYEMEELPFPYAKNNDELINNIINFNYENYLENWETFKIRTGLYESGHAAKDIAYVINEFVKGNTKPLEDIQNEE